MIIRGNTVGTTMPRANWNQADPKKADYVVGKETVDAAIQKAQEMGAKVVGVPVQNREWAQT